jgi:hypothetical protein
MHFSKLSRAELLGLIAAILLVAALLLLDWFTLADTPNRDAGSDFVCGQDNYTCSGWDTFPILRWVLLAVALAPPILAYIVVRGHKLSWAPGELTMVLGFTAFVLIAYNGLIDPPGTQTAEIGITKEVGYYVALFASLGVSAAGIGRAMEADKGPRKAPGTV